jgi:predicted transposase YbfD/YdcC
MARPPHLVAALAHGIGAVLGQVAVDAKSNEIPAVRDLLKAFASLASAVVTIDAMHTQHDTAQVILGRGADYVMTVKGNMPARYRQLKKLPWARIPAVSSVSTDHGRRARRTIKVALAPAWIGFDSAAQVAQLRRTVTRKGKKTVEVVYRITSDRDASPATLAVWIRGHREIETVFTTSATRPSAKISSAPAPGTSPMPTQPSATSSPAPTATPASPTSPTPAATTHATTGASSPSTDTPEQRPGTSSP